MSAKDVGLLVIRIGVGAMFIWHGVSKFAGGAQVLTGVGGAVEWFGVQDHYYLWGVVAALVESVGGLMLMLGIFFRFFAFLLILQMVMASSWHLRMQHSFANASHAIELGIVFLGLLIMGPGRIALGRSLYGREARQEKAAE